GSDAAGDRLGSAVSGSFGVAQSAPPRGGPFRIQSVRLVGVVADETHRQLTDKPIRERGAHQRHFMRRGALEVDGDGTALTISDGHDLRPFAALPTAAPPLLAGAKLPSMNASCRSR